MYQDFDWLRISNIKSAEKDFPIAIKFVRYILYTRANFDSTLVTSALAACGVKRQIFYLPNSYWKSAHYYVFTSLISAFEECGTVARNLRLTIFTDTKRLQAYVAASGIVSVAIYQTPNQPITFVDDPLLWGHR